ncbi:hypothetical protein MRX96_035390 [Rhipicephalus microplus]
MVRSGGISIVGASTGVSCAVVRLHPRQCLPAARKGKGDEEERELIDRGRLVDDGAGSMDTVRPPARWPMRRGVVDTRGRRQAPWTSVRKPSKQTTWCRDRYDDEKTSRAWMRPRQSWTGDQDLVARTVAFREPKVIAEAWKSRSQKPPGPPGPPGLTKGAAPYRLPQRPPFLTKGLGQSPWLRAMVELHWSRPAEQGLSRTSTQGRGTLGLVGKAALGDHPPAKQATPEVIAQYSGDSGVSLLPTAERPSPAAAPRSEATKWIP